MYIACKQIRVASGLIPAGELVLDFEKWPIAAQRAAINNGAVKFSPDENPVIEQGGGTEIHTDPGLKFICLDCARAFASQKALTSHRSRSHK